MDTQNPPEIVAVPPLEVAERMLGRKVLAALLGTGVTTIGNWKKRGVPIERCIGIERATSGAVTRKDLRPDDWKAIWPEAASPDWQPATVQPTTEPAQAGV